MSTEINAAAMREALEQIRDMIMGGGFDGRSPAYIVNICDAALSKPPRNCDRFKTKEEAAIAFAKEKKQWIPQQVLWGLALWLDWLFAPSTEQKGEANEQK